MPLLGEVSLEGSYSIPSLKLVLLIPHQTNDFLLNSRLAVLTPNFSPLTPCTQTSYKVIDIVVNLC